MDDYWKGEIKCARKSGLCGSVGRDRYLVEILWFFTKAQILAEGEHGRDITR